MRRTKSYRISNGVEPISLIWNVNVYVILLIYIGGPFHFYSFNANGFVMKMEVLEVQLNWTNLQIKQAQLRCK